MPLIWFFLWQVSKLGELSDGGNLKVQSYKTFELLNKILLTISSAVPFVIVLASHTSNSWRKRGGHQILIYTNYIFSIVIIHNSCLVIIGLICISQILKINNHACIGAIRSDTSGILSYPYSETEEPLWHYFFLEGKGIDILYITVWTYIISVY